MLNPTKRRNEISMSVNTNLDECFKTLIKDSDDDNYQYDGSNSVNYMRYSPNFRFIIALRGKEPPAEFASKFQVVNVRK